MCCNTNKVNSTNNSPQLSFRFTCQNNIYKFINLSQQIFKKGGYIPVLDNYKNEIFPMKRAFLGET